MAATHITVRMTIRHEHGTKRYHAFIEHPQKAPTRDEWYGDHRVSADCFCEPVPETMPRSQIKIFSHFVKRAPWR